jgi:hypothetical protein
MNGGSTVFISYAADTKPRAQELTRALEIQGIDAWVDFKDLRPGQRWKDELERAIGAARWLLVLVGSGSRSTAWQEAEWSAALCRSWADRETQLLPIVFGETEPPPFLRNWVSLKVDADKEPATWTRHVLDVLQGVRKETVYVSGLQSRRQRQTRLDEISQAAQELRESHAEESPVESPGLIQVRPE